MIGSDATSRILLEVAWILLIGFSVFGLACVVALIGIRARRRLLAHRHQAEEAGLRADLISVLVGEEPDSTEAASRLVALRGRQWGRADELLVRMLTKVRGDARARVMAVLVERGAEERAVRQVLSIWSVGRCRGAFALGALGAANCTGYLVALLDDRSPLVRRVAVRALGTIGDPTSTESLLNLSNQDLGVQRDLLLAVVSLGPQTAPRLRRRVVDRTMRPDGADRSAPLAATALGLLGEVAAARELAEALDRGPVPLQLAAAQALGQLDAPVGVPALQRALVNGSDQVRFAAASSLGRLGVEAAVPDLLAAVELADPTVSRSAASALLALGPAGRAALAGSAAPYAIEAVAVDAMRRSS